jgi:uncharacterized protein (TIGR02996 family)
MPRPLKGLSQQSRPEVLAFLRDIKANPEDDTPRLILADWLEERGDPRGEYVRLECALARMQPTHPRWQAAYTRRQELWQRHATEWVGPLPGWAWDRRPPGLGRGLGRLEVPVWEFLKAPKALAETEAYAWVEELVLSGMTPVRLGKLAASPNLEGPATVTLRQHELVAGELVTLLDSPRLARLTGLALSGKPLRDRGAMAIAVAPQLARLHTLDLSSNLIGAEGIAALAASPYLNNLTALDLFDNSAGPSGTEAVASSPHLGRLTSLSLGINRVGDSGAVPLASSPFLNRLEKLFLGENQIGPAGAKALAASPNLSHLNLLRLYSNHLGDEGAAALAASPALAQLVNLDLRSNRLGDQGAESLAASPHLSRLAWLDLRSSRGNRVAEINNYFSNAAIAALRRRFGECVRF